MRILLVDIPPALTTPLHEALAQNHLVSVFDGDVRDATACAAHADQDAVIHGEPLDGADLSTQVDRATRGTWNLLTTTNAARFVQLSTMHLFDDFGTGWQIGEDWVPRPRPLPRELCAHLAELTSRELTRVRPVSTRVLRLDDLADEQSFTAGDSASTSLHVDDAVAAIQRAVELEVDPSAPRWRVWHIVSGDGRYPLLAAARAPLGFTPSHTADPAAERPPFSPPTLPPAAPVPRQLLPARRITVLGGGGPLGAGAYPELVDGRTLRITDARPLAELAQRPPQSPGAPRLAVVASPHEEQVVDVTDLAAVRASAQGADCLLNCSVVRTDPVGAFRVNVLGALHTMLAAVDAGVPRVIHTGPTLVLAPHPVGYTDDPAISEGLPPRPGEDLYFMTKLLGQEICRIFARHHGIATPILLFCGFVEPSVGEPADLHPFSVSWRDAGRAISAAAAATGFTEISPILHILAPSPHGRYEDRRAREELGWEAVDRLVHHWYRH
jgi:nucleoside-diphosphate-sugar epimerase